MAKRWWIKTLRQNLLLLSCGGGLLLAILLSCMAARWERQAQAVRADTLRLHIVPCSDSVMDQNAKLRVRDALLARSALLYAGQETQQQVQYRTAQALPGLLLWARHTLLQQHCREKVTVSITKENFATRKYDGYTLPAGEYRALRVAIGQGAGHNWWCCLYPKLCLAASSGYAEPTEEDFVVGGHILRFKAVEWWQKCFAAAPAEEPRLVLQSGG